MQHRFSGLRQEDSVDIRSVQKLAWDNKIAKGFNTTDVPMEFCLLNGEVAEAFDAWRKGRQDVGEELADSAIYLLGLAEMIGIDLQNEIAAKIEKNASRVYQQLSNGMLVKTEAGGSAGAQPEQ
jgi:NTP pyrophosphatase (non-canonical NTP hydrolase)